MGVYSYQVRAGGAGAFYIGNYGADILEQGDVIHGIGVLLRNGVLRSVSIGDKGYFDAVDIHDYRRVPLLPA